MKITYALTAALAVQVCISDSFNEKLTAKVNEFTSNKICEIHSKEFRSSLQNATTFDQEMKKCLILMDEISKLSHKRLEYIKEIIY